MGPAARRKRINTQTRILAELNQQLQEKQGLLLTLSAERQRLAGKAAAIQAAVLQAEALASLAASLRPPEGRRADSGPQSYGSCTDGGGCSSGGGSGGGDEHRGSSGVGGEDALLAGDSLPHSREDAGDSGGMSAAPQRERSDAPAPPAREQLAMRWQQELGRTIQELAAAGGGSGHDKQANGHLEGSSDRDGSTDEAAGKLGGTGQPINVMQLEVHWWPAGSAYSGLRHESTESLQATCIDVLRLFGCLLPRIRYGAPDAEDCLAQLRSEAARNFAAHAVLTLETSAVLGEIFMRPLESRRAPAAPAAASAGAGGGAGAGEAPGDGVEGGGGAGAGCGGGRGKDMADESEVPMSHWLYAMEQAALSADQEKVAAAAIEEWVARGAALLRRREALMQWATAKPAGGEAKLLHELAAIQTAVIVNLAVFSLVIYDSIMSVEQFASFALACWPRIPTLESFAAALEAKMEQRKSEERRQEQQERRLEQQERQRQLEQQRAQEQEQDSSQRMQERQGGGKSPSDDRSSEDPPGSPDCAGLSRLHVI